MAGWFLAFRIKYISMSLIIKRSVLFGLRAPHHSQVRFGTNIPVLLLEDVEKKGKAGEVIVVSRGFARNYLVPQKIAGKYLLLYNNNLVIYVHWIILFFL